MVPVNPLAAGLVRHGKYACLGVIDMASAMLAVHHAK